MEEDFKYFMQDAEKLYFGARLSYAELLEHEFVPFKFKTVIGRYLVRDIDDSTTLESQLYHLTRQDEAFGVFRELKANVRVVEPDTPRGITAGKLWNRLRGVSSDDGPALSEEIRTGRGGLPADRYRERVYTVSALAAIPAEDKEAAGMAVRELILSKLALFVFTV